MLKNEAQMMLDMLNCIWARADDTRENMTEDEARCSYVVPDMIRKAGYAVEAGSDGVLRLATGS